MSTQPPPRAPIGPRRHGCAGFLLYIVIGFAGTLALIALGPLAIVLAIGAAFIYAISRIPL